MHRRNFVGGAAASLVGVAVAAPASAQLGGLGGLGKKLGSRLPIGNLLGGKPPITTELADAKWGDAEYDNFTPREAPRDMLTLQRTPNGGFVLQPGYYK